jgi:hypothetical protein
LAATAHPAAYDPLVHPLGLDRAAGSQLLTERLLGLPKSIIANQA